eukprot:1465_1
MSWQQTMDSMFGYYEPRKPMPIDNSLQSRSHKQHTHHHHAHRGAYHHHHPMKLSSFDRPIGIFLNRQNAYNYKCAICQSVFTNATSIGCPQDDMFCRQCLEAYYSDDTTKQCPSCRQRGLTKAYWRPCKYIDRIVQSEKVKCLLQFTEKSEFETNLCAWEGELINLAKHINIDCPLYLMVCDDCQQPMRRCNAQAHGRFCEDRKLPCTNCNMMIARKEMAVHKRDLCTMTKLTCDECKTDVLRKDMQYHVTHLCPEYEAHCPFFRYGCHAMIKRRLMNTHLTQYEVSHLKLKVASLEQHHCYNEHYNTRPKNMYDYLNLNLMKYFNWQRP